MCIFQGGSSPLTPPAQVVSEVSGLPGLWVQTSLGCEPVGCAHHRPHPTEGKVRPGLLGLVAVSPLINVLLRCHSPVWCLVPFRLHTRPEQARSSLAFCKLLHLGQTAPSNPPAPRSPSGPGRPRVSDHRLHLNPTCRRSLIIDEVLGPVQHRKRCLHALGPGRFQYERSPREERGFLPDPVGLRELRACARDGTERCPGLGR